MIYCCVVFFWFSKRNMQKRTVCLFGIELQWSFHYELTPDSFFAVCLIFNLSYVSFTTVHFLSSRRYQHFLADEDFNPEAWFQGDANELKDLLCRFFKNYVFCCVDFFCVIIRNMQKRTDSLFEIELQWWFHYKLTPDSFFAVCLIASSLSYVSFTSVHFLSYWRCQHLADKFSSFFNHDF